jgi:hypothetical protein
VDARRFDHMTRSFGATFSRRSLLSSLTVTIAVIAGASFGGSHLAAKKQRKRKPKPGKPNAFGCINVGDRCRHGEQCCSGICEGKKGKKRCRSHDTGGCSVPSEFPPDSCTVETILCTTATGAAGTCGTTTGNAPYCAGDGDCRPCTKDADCQTLCGPRAACIQCPGACNVGTACMGPDSVVCPI